MFTHTMLGVEYEKTQVRVAVRFADGATTVDREWVLSNGQGREYLAAQIKAYQAELDRLVTLRSDLATDVGKAVALPVDVTPTPVDPNRQAYQDAARKLKSMEAAIASGIMKATDPDYLAVQATAKALFDPAFL